MRWPLLLVPLAAACASFSTTGASPPADGGTTNGPDGSTKPVTEGGTEPVPLEAGASSFCTDGLFLCDEFERDTLVASPWVLATDGKHDSDPVIDSPPVPFSGRAAHFSLIEKGGVSGHKFLSSAPTSIGSATTMDGEIAFLTTSLPARQTDIITVILTIGPQSQLISFGYNADGTVGASTQFVTGPMNYESLTESAPLAEKKWVHLTMHVAMQTGTVPQGHVTASVDDVQFLDSALPAIPPQPGTTGAPPPTMLSFSIGPDYAVDGAATDRYLDNVKATLGN